MGGSRRAEDLAVGRRESDAESPATAQDRVDHRTALAGLGMPDEQKILLAYGSGTNGIFTKMVVDLQPAVRHLPDQGFPAAEECW